MLSTETEFISRNTCRLKVREWIQVFKTDGNQKKAGVAIFISDRLDFKIKTVIRDKEGHYIMNRISTKRCNNCKYIRQTTTAINGDINSKTIIMGVFNTPLSSMGKSSRQKIVRGHSTLRNPICCIFLPLCAISQGFSVPYQFLFQE